MGLLEIIQNLDQVTASLWPEEHYAALNVIYKAAKNPQKMVDALKKHKAKLLKYAEEYIILETNSFVNEQSKKAFTAIKDYYDGSIDAGEILKNIESAIMIQRMVSKAKEIYREQYCSGRV